MMGSFINFFLLTLVSEKHRKFVKSSYYVAISFFFIFLLTNFVRLLPLPSKFINAFFISLLCITAVSFAVYKISYLIFRKNQNVGGDEILTKYNQCFDKHMKKSNLTLILAIVCFILIIITAIIGSAYEDKNHIISICCIILVFPFLIGAITFMAISYYNVFAFGKKEEHKEVITLRKEQVLNTNNENFKAIASGAVNYSRLEDYLYPVPSFKKRYKKNSNIFGIFLVITIFAVMIPILTVVLMSENKNSIFQVIAVSFSLLLFVVMIETLIFSHLSTRLIKKTKEYLEGFSERYFANITYIDLLLENEKKQKKYSFFMLGGMLISFILGFTAGVLGLNNPITEGLIISAISVFFVICGFSIIASLIIARKNKSKLLEVQLNIEKQEKEYAEKQIINDEKIN